MLFKDVNNDLKFSVYQTCVDKHETHNLCPRSLLSMGNRKKKSNMIQVIIIQSDMLENVRQSGCDRSL